MKTIRLGKTDIIVCQNGFGALPIQRLDTNTAVTLLHHAYDGGFRFFDTAHSYSDSEEKIGIAFEGIRDIFIASKSQATEPQMLLNELNVSLRRLKREYIDVFQFHSAKMCYKPGDGTGLYETMLKAKEQGKIRYIGLTTHRIDVAEEASRSGLYDTVQFPFSYIASDRDVDLVKTCADNGVGFIAMKGLGGGLLTDSSRCMAFMNEFDNVLPIWGIQRESELQEWVSYFADTPEMNDEIREQIKRDRKELLGDFCRGCGYCLPCTAGIIINNCARMSQLLRRLPSENWLTPKWQAEMAKIPECIHCNECMSRCPYSLNIPELLKKNYNDYQDILSGIVKI